MSPAPRIAASVLLAILLAQLALMASPLHAADLHAGHGARIEPSAHAGGHEHGGHGGTAGDTQHSARPGRSGHAAPDHARPPQAAPPDAGDPDAGVDGAQPGAAAQLHPTGEHEDAQDCAVTPGPSPKRWGPEPGGARSAIPVPAFSPAPPALLDVAAMAPRAPPAGSLAFLQVFRN